MNLFNYDNSNINRYKNRVSQLIDKKNQIYSKVLQLPFFDGKIYMLCPNSSVG